MGDPEQEDQEDDEGGDKDGENAADKGEEEGVVLPGVGVRLAKLACHEFVIPPVRFPRDVENVAEDGDGSDDDFDAEVDHHADEGDVGDAANPGGEDDDEGGEAGKDVSESGDEADEAVEADADGREGDAEPVVEQMREEVDVLVRAPAFGALAEGEGGGQGPGFCREVFGRQNFGF